MKTIFDPSTRAEIKQRIASLNENSTAQWGKMNVCQMMKHCIMTDEMFLGKKVYKRKMIGRLLGKVGLRQILKDEKPMQKNAPTLNAFKIKEQTCDLTNEKMQWMQLIDEYAAFSNENFTHWFFGKMTREQVGQFVFKHNDHHLRQFNV
jgi:hypothetical protein